MGDDQIAAIRPAIAQALEASTADDVRCASFEVSGDTARWVQVLPDAINMAYPAVEPPEILPAHVHVLSLREWKADEYATFDVAEGVTAMDLARIVDALFQGVLGCGSDYRLDVRVEKLG